jgi:tetratricopeptide (TPR) repeat protein
VIWFRNSRRAKAEAASAALPAAGAEAETAQLESALAAAGSSGPADLLKLTLARKYYSEGRYDEALAKYEEIDAGGPAGFEGYAAYGKACCKEAKGDAAGAREAFRKFAADFPRSPLLTEAKIGAARNCGSDETAIAELKALQAESEAVSNRVEIAIDAIMRKPSAEPAPMPAAPAAEPAKSPVADIAAAIDEAAKAEVKPEAKPAVKPAAKPETKPAAKPAAKPEAKPAPKAEAKPAAKAEAKPAAKTEAKPAAKPAAKPETKPAAKPAAGK